jgi:hypothetical protein
VSRAPATFRQTDVAKVLKAAIAAGVRARVTIDREGRITIEMVDGQTEPVAEGRGVNEWDTV